MAEIQDYIAAVRSNGAFEERIKVTLSGDLAAFIGTGDFNSYSTASGYHSFYPAFAVDRRFFYVAEQIETPFKWEIGVGYQSGIGTIVREQILVNSASGISLTDFNNVADLVIFSTIPAVHHRRSQPGRLLASARGLAML